MLEDSAMVLRIGPRAGLEWAAQPDSLSERGIIRVRMNAGKIVRCRSVKSSQRRYFVVHIQTSPWFALRLFFN